MRRQSGHRGPSFGPIGFIVGPIVCGLFLTVWEIYGATFKAILPPVEPSEIAKS